MSAAKTDEGVVVSDDDQVLIPDVVIMSRAAAGYEEDDTSTLNEQERKLIAEKLSKSGPLPCAACGSRLWELGPHLTSLPAIVKSVANKGRPIVPCVTLFCSNSGSDRLPSAAKMGVARRLWSVDR